MNVFKREEHALQCVLCGLWVTVELSTVVIALMKASTYRFVCEKCMDCGERRN